MKRKEKRKLSGFGGEFIELAEASLSELQLRVSLA